MWKYKKNSNSNPMHFSAFWSEMSMLCNIITHKCISINELNTLIPHFKCGQTNKQNKTTIVWLTCTLSIGCTLSMMPMMVEGRQCHA